MSSKARDLERVLEQSLDAAIIVDSQNRVHYHNPAYATYSHRAPGELTVAAAGGMPCHRLFTLEVCADRCLMRRALETKQPECAAEVRAWRADGEEVKLLVSAVPLSGGMVVETYREMSPARREGDYRSLLERERAAKQGLEQKFRERTQELEDAQEKLIHTEKMSSLGRLVAGIAHELNNPINFIYGNVDFLGQYFGQLLALIRLYEQGELPVALREDARRFKEKIDFAFLSVDWERLLASIRAGAERAAEIVTDLRTFSRPQRGRLEETDLIAGLETTLHLLQPLLRDRITVHRALEPLPPVRCAGGQLQQVFMNLLENAAHAAGAGGSIWVEARPDPGGVRVSVRDSGPGVPAELAPKIFDPFFTTKEVGEGTGLGLAISERVVRSHGGRIELAAPSPGRGAEFIVWLPLAPPG